jgi:hypothetical protein
MGWVLAVEEKAWCVSVLTELQAILPFFLSGWKKKLAIAGKAMLGCPRVEICKPPPGGTILASVFNGGSRRE